MAETVQSQRDSQIPYVTFWQPGSNCGAGLEEQVEGSNIGGQCEQLSSSSYTLSRVHSQGPGLKKV